MPTPTCRLSFPVKWQSFAPRPQPMILVMMEISSRRMEKITRLLVMPLTLALMPTLAKNTGVSSKKLRGSNLDWI